MTDMLHSLINKARDDLKNSINDTIEMKFALLESKIRDSQNIVNPEHNGNLKSLQDYIKKEISSLKDANTNICESGLLSIKNELMAFIGTSKAASQIPTGHNISDNLVIERIEPDEDKEPVFTPLEVGDETYWLDSSYKLYKETEEGYEEINGTYDPETGELDLEEDDAEEAEEEMDCEEDEDEETEEETEEEETEEAEEFTYKNKTYYRDSNNNVYNAEGDILGIWTGSVIKFIIKTT